MCASSPSVNGRPTNTTRPRDRILQLTPLTDRELNQGECDVSGNACPAVLNTTPTPGVNNIYGNTNTGARDYKQNLGVMLSTSVCSISNLDQKNIRTFQLTRQETFLKNTHTCMDLNQSPTYIKQYETVENNISWNSKENKGSNHNYDKNRTITLSRHCSSKPERRACDVKLSKCSRELHQLMRETVEELNCHKYVHANIASDDDDQIHTIDKNKLKYESTNSLLKRLKLNLIRANHQIKHNVGGKKIPQSNADSRCCFKKKCTENNFSGCFDNLCKNTSENINKFKGESKHYEEQNNVSLIRKSQQDFENLLSSVSEDIVYHVWRSKKHECENTSRSLNRTNSSFDDKHKRRRLQSRSRCVRPGTPYPLHIEYNQVTDENSTQTTEENRTLVPYENRTHATQCQDSEKIYMRRSKTRDKRYTNINYFDSTQESFIDTTTQIKLQNHQFVNYPDTLLSRLYGHKNESCNSLTRPNRQTRKGYPKRKMSSCTFNSEQESSASEISARDLSEHVISEEKCSNQWHNSGKEIIGKQRCDLFKRITPLGIETKLDNEFEVNGLYEKSKFRPIDSLNTLPSKSYNNKISLRSKEHRNKRKCRQHSSESICNLRSEDTYFESSSMFTSRSSHVIDESNTLISNKKTRPRYISGELANSTKEFVNRKMKDTSPTTKGFREIYLTPHLKNTLELDSRVPTKDKKIILEDDGYKSERDITTDSDKSDTSTTLNLRGNKTQETSPDTTTMTSQSTSNSSNVSSTSTAIDELFPSIYSNHSNYTNYTNTKSYSLYYSKSDSETYTNTKSRKHENRIEPKTSKLKKKNYTESPPTIHLDNEQVSYMKIIPTGYAPNQFTLRNIILSTKGNNHQSRKRNCKEPTRSSVCLSTSSDVISPFRTTTESQFNSVIQNDRTITSSKMSQSFSYQQYIYPQLENQNKVKHSDFHTKVTKYENDKIQLKRNPHTGNKKCKCFKIISKRRNNPDTGKNKTEDTSHQVNGGTVSENNTYIPKSTHHSTINTRTSQQNKSETYVKTSEVSLQEGTTGHFSNKHIKNAFCPMYNPSRQVGSTDTQRRDGSIGTPQRDGSISTPQRDGSVGTPQRDSSIGPPQRDSSIGTPQRDSSIGTPQRDVSINTLRRDGSIDTPHQDDSIDTPRRVGSINTPQRNGSINTRRRNGSIGSLRRDGSIATPQRDCSIDTPRLDTATAKTPEYVLLGNDETTVEKNVITKIAKQLQLLIDKGQSKRKRRYKLKEFASKIEMVDIDKEPTHIYPVNRDLVDKSITHNGIKPFTEKKRHSSSHISYHSGIDNLETDMDMITSIPKQKIANNKHISHKKITCGLNEFIDMSRKQLIIPVTMDSESRYSPESPTKTGDCVLIKSDDGVHSATVFCKYTSHVDNEVSPQHYQTIQDEYKGQIKPLDNKSDSISLQATPKSNVESADTRANNYTLENNDLFPLLPENIVSSNWNLLGNSLDVRRSNHSRSSKNDLSSTKGLINQIENYGNEFEKTGLTLKQKHDYLEHKSMSSPVTRETEVDAELLLQSDQLSIQSKQPVIASTYCHPKNTSMIPVMIKATNETSAHENEIEQKELKYSNISQQIMHRPVMASKIPVRLKHTPKLSQRTRKYPHISNKKSQIATKIKKFDSSQRRMEVNRQVEFKYEGQCKFNSISRSQQQYKAKERKQFPGVHIENASKLLFDGKPAAWKSAKYLKSF